MTLKYLDTDSPPVPAATQSAQKTHNTGSTIHVSHIRYIHYDQGRGKCYEVGGANWQRAGEEVTCNSPNRI